jgi:hypothetical protein
MTNRLYVKTWLRWKEIPSDGDIAIEDWEIRIENYEVFATILEGEKVVRSGVLQYI